MSLLTDLKALLIKHGCYLAWSCDDCSDLHGVYDQRIEFCEEKELFCLAWLAIQYQNMS